MRPSTTSSQIRVFYGDFVPSLRQSGTQWRGPCPIHNGTGDNFAVKAETGEWFCHSRCQRGGTMAQLKKELNGLPAKVSPNENSSRRVKNPLQIHSDKTTQFPYFNRDGKLLYTVERTDKWTEDGATKSFRQFRHSGEIAALTVDPDREVPKYLRVHQLDAGDYKLSKSDGESCFHKVEKYETDDVYRFGECPRVPYRLPELLGRCEEMVFLVEGEKNVTDLESWGLLASCNSGGCGGSRWYAQWGEYFSGREIVILPDNDAGGRMHAASVARALHSVAASIRILELPGLSKKGDVSDWMEAGGKLEEFKSLVARLLPLQPNEIEELSVRWGEVADRLSQGTRSSGRKLAIRCLADVHPEAVEWLWPGCMARRKVSLVVGQPGLGKSTITASIAATVSKGGQWPAGGGASSVGTVILLSAEDGASDTIRPRLEAAGADLSRIHIIDGVRDCSAEQGAGRSDSFRLDRDLEALREKITELGDVALVVIDPISAYMGGVDSHKNAEVRSMLAPLSRLAEELSVAILCISHFNKTHSAESLNRVSGSIAFAATARAVFCVLKDPLDDSRRLLMPMKNNNGIDTGGFGYRIVAVSVPNGTDAIETARVEWETNLVPGTADQIIKTSARPSSSGEAQTWLRHILAESLPAAEVFELAGQSGFASRTISRASKSIGVKRQKQGMAGGWRWSLPKMPNNTEDAI